MDSQKRPASHLHWQPQRPLSLDNIADYTFGCNRRWGNTIETRVHQAPMKVAVAGLHDANDHLMMAVAVEAIAATNLSCHVHYWAR